MLQVINDTIRETPSQTFTASETSGSVGGYPTSNCIDYGGTGYWPYPTVYWNSYPVYICTDKTKKAIDVLKALQAEKLLKCDSVPRFIALVDKIAGLL